MVGRKREKVRAARGINVQKTLETMKKVIKANRVSLARRRTKKRSLRGGPERSDWRLRETRKTRLR